MKFKKLFSLVLAIAVVFTASCMMLEVFAQAFNEYRSATNGNSTVKATGSVQAGKHLNCNYYSSVYATNRIDPLTDNASGSYYLMIDVYCCTQEEIKESFHVESEDPISITDDIRHINFDEFNRYGGPGLKADLQIDTLWGVYTVVDARSLEEVIFIPDICMTLE